MEQLTNLIISDRELTVISHLLAKLMNDTNATFAMLIDKSGQVVAYQGGGARRNVATTLGALLAGVFSSSREVARVIIFDKLTHIGLVKVISKKATEELGRILERVRSDTTRTKSSVINVQFRSSVEDTIDLLFRD
jgi:hypothetical protein